MGRTRARPLCTPAPGFSAACGFLPKEAASSLRPGEPALRQDTVDFLFSALQRSCHQHVTVRSPYCMPGTWPGAGVTHKRHRGICPHDSKLKEKGCAGEGLRSCCRRRRRIRLRPHLAEMPQLTRLMDSSNEKQISWFQEERSGFFLTWVTDLYPQTQVETGEPSSAFLLPLSLPGPSRGERGRPHGKEGKDSSVTTPSRGQPSLVLEKERGVFLRAAEAGPCGRSDGTFLAASAQPRVA